MNKIKVSHEVPICLLESSLSFNDYQYCLPHLMDENEQYRKFFLTCRDIGVEIYMDNSLHELGHFYDPDRLMYWLEELKPSTFFIPDVWEDKTDSIKQAIKWADIKVPDGVEKVAVVQAFTYEDAVECYKTYKELGYKKIAFSYGATYYGQFYANFQRDKAKAMGRIYVIKDMYEKGIIQNEDRVHLLGCAIPQEFKSYEGLPFIESIDTSNPIMATIANMRYTKNGIHRKPGPNMNETVNIEFNKINHELLTNNIKMFRIINNL